MPACEKLFGPCKLRLTLSFLTLLAAFILPRMACGQGPGVEWRLCLQQWEFWNTRLTKGRAICGWF